MGEYAIRKSDGERVKIGTCEQMYYLRADQAHQVRAEHGNVDPVADRFGVRFRFPWPDEDHLQPGDDGPDHNYERTRAVHGVAVPDGVDHSHVQFIAGQNRGFNVCLPCPELGDTGMIGLDHGGDHAYKVHRNGYAGAVRIHSQKWVRADEDGPERLVTVCACGGCGALWRLHSWEMAEPVVVALRAEADRLQLLSDRHPEGPIGPDAGAVRLHAIADRITAGYNLEPAAV